MWWPQELQEPEPFAECVHPDHHLRRQQLQPPQVERLRMRQLPRSSTVIPLSSLKEGGVPYGRPLGEPPCDLFTISPGLPGILEFSDVRR